AALGRQVLADPAAGPADLVRLGYLFENQLRLLAELRKRQLLPPADADRLAAELDGRIVATWTAVVERDPKQPAGHIGLALARYRAGAADEALAVLENGLKACGDRVELLAAFADLTRRRDPKAGLELLTRAARNRPTDPAVWRLVAQAAAAAGRPDVALAACDEALRLRPGQPWACRLRAGVLLDQGRATEAVAALEPVRAGLAADAAAAELYVAALCAAGTDAGLDPLFRDMTAKPNPAPGLTGGARALVRAGRPQTAAAWAGEAVRRAPDDVAARRLYADCLRARAEEDGAPGWNAVRVDEAVRAYEWVRDRLPHDLAVANDLAWLQLKGQGRPETALATAAPLRARESAAGGLP